MGVGGQHHTLAVLPPGPVWTSSFFHWRYSPLWALACRKIPLHFSLSITNSLRLLTPSTLRSLSTSSLHPFLGLPLRLVHSNTWVKIFLRILSSILSRWPSQLILCPFIHFNIFSPLLNSSSSQFVLLFSSPSLYLGPYILLNIFLSKISRWPVWTDAANIAPTWIWFPDCPVRSESLYWLCYPGPHN